MGLGVLLLPAVWRCCGGACCVYTCGGEKNASPEAGGVAAAYAAVMVSTASAGDVDRDGALEFRDLLSVAYFYLGYLSEFPR